MKKKPEYETVDCTPTWEGLLPMMMDIIHRKGPYDKNMRPQFISMAKNADKLLVLAKLVQAHLEADFRQRGKAFKELQDFMNTISWPGKYKKPIELINEFLALIEQPDFDLSDISNEVIEHPECKEIIKLGKKMKCINSYSDGWDWVNPKTGQNYSTPT